MWTIIESTKAEQEFLDHALGDYNMSQVSMTQDTHTIFLNYCVKDNGKVIAGINAELYIWKIAYISILYVDEKFRGQKLGSQLIQKVEAEAIAAGAKLAHTDTFDFQAKDFYLKQGYQIFGVLQDCPEGHKRYYLRKNLVEPETKIGVFSRKLSALNNIDDVKALLPVRPLSTHKGDFGHVLVIGGNNGYAGAPLLVGLGALRVGAGLVTIATRPEHVNGILAAAPEIMARGVEGADQLDELMQKVSFIVIGPGLGQDAWAASLFQATFDSGKPLLIDADGLNLLAKGKVAPRDNWILTPHPGEAARLLGVTIAEIEQDRHAAITQLQERFGGHVVLKGAGSLIMCPTHEITVCPFGNPGMAVGGMGDLLSGVIAGFCAQKMPFDEATILGVFLHGLAGDKASEAGERGLMPTDLLPIVRQMVN